MDLNSASPAPPYTTWATAATNIQDAIDAADAGDEVVVNDGVYQTGRRAVDADIENRVAVTKPVTVRSVNGPGFTVIRGYKVPGTTTGYTAVRCVYLAEGAMLVGFTLTNGATLDRGDRHSELSGGGVWCASANVVVSNCVMIGNVAKNSGGGAYQGTLNDCILSANSSGDGNTDSGESGGGGAAWSTLNSCTLTGNSADYGGGASSGMLNNCTLTGNSAIWSGGGAFECELNNCTLTGNTADYGGGVSECKPNNCVVYYNSARVGGANYFDDDEVTTFNYSCTTPLPPRGAGNISAEPELASASHLSAGSPCRGTGSAAYVTGVDIDGETWANPPSIGCDEFQSGAMTGPLSVSIGASYTNVGTGFEVNLTAQISGHDSVSRWEFGDGTVLSNRPYAAHTWADPGDYSVVLRAYNESYPGGVSATLTMHVVEEVHYVAAGGSHPVSPYSSWATAATNIQDAVDAASVVGALVVVSNGVYQTGGQGLNRVAVTKPLTVRSVNGVGVTVIDGGGFWRRCVYLSEGAALVGFTLTNGATLSFIGFFDSVESSGGGVRCASASALVSNCVLSGNSAEFGGGGAYRGTLSKCVLEGNSSARIGGGAYQCTLNNCTLARNSTGDGGGVYQSALNNCTLVGNSATDAGGGASYSALNNCTLTGNSASSFGGGASGSTLNNCTLAGNSASVDGGGVFQSALNNCVVYFNYAGRVGVNYSWATLNYSCTTPLPTNGSGNITNAPLFVDLAGGNLRLQANSPCIDAGTDLSAIITNDLDGRPRPLDGDGDGIAAFDMGAYEYRALHVWQESPSPAPPFGTWATAATNIQDAIDAALPGDDIVVTNGVYATGGRVVDGAITNRVAVEKSLTLRSVNGPDMTVIDGTDAMRCVYLTGGATLVGFTLINGRADDGGGVFCESSSVVSNCVFTNNSASFGGGGAYQGTLNNCKLTGNWAAGIAITGYGGGTFLSTLNNCTLTGNLASIAGGGAYAGSLNNCTLTGNLASIAGGGACICTLNNCTLTGNSVFGLYGEGGGAYAGSLNNCTLIRNSASRTGGGASGGTLNNCIVYYNGAMFSGENYDGGTFSYSCTTPLPEGAGNITNEPAFIDLVGGNLRLDANSPCINAGFNSFAPGGTDLDGLPRIAGGTVDMGTYEFQNPTSLLSYAWLQQFGLPIDGSADNTDPDGDHLTNFQEWRAGTDPTNASSVLRLLSPTISGSDVVLTWESVVGRNYFVELSMDLGALPRFQTLATHIPAQPGTTTFTHTGGASSGPAFYRVGVEEQ